jgi:hypothetical protein
VAAGRVGEATISYHGCPSKTVNFVSLSNLHLKMNNEIDKEWPHRKYLAKELNDKCAYTVLHWIRLILLVPDLSTKINSTFRQWFEKFKCTKSN